MRRVAATVSLGCVGKRGQFQFGESGIGATKPGVRPRDVVPNTAGPTVGKQQPPTDALAVDEQGQFIKKHLSRATAKGRLSPKAAKYYEESFRRFHEMRPLVEMAKDHVGDQDTELWTNYQQQQFNNLMGDKAGEIAAIHLQRVYKEQQEIKEFAEKGTPTGENYWIEAPATLLNPDVPYELKQEIWEDMIKDRPKDPMEAAREEAERQEQRREYTKPPPLPRENE